MVINLVKEKEFILWYSHWWWLLSDWLKYQIYLFILLKLLVNRFLKGLIQFQNGFLSYSVYFILQVKFGCDLLKVTNSLMVELQPWALLINTTGFHLYMTKNNITLVSLPHFSVVAPPQVQVCLLLFMLFWFYWNLLYEVLFYFFISTRVRSS